MGFLPGRNRAFFLATLFIFFSQHLLANESEWSLEKEEDGISILSRAVSHSDFREFQAQMTIDGKIDTVLAIFQDPKSFTRWVHQCSSAEIIQQNSFLDVFVYQVSDMPILVSDRDVVIRDVYSYSKDYKEWTIEVTAVEGMVPETGNVRVTDSHGTYQLKQINDEQVSILWTQHADPAGTLPSWLVNSLIVDLPFETLKSLRELTTEEQYQTSKIGYDQNGVPSHWAVQNF
ncbi:START domain-containing protein [Litoribacillus peritrichatus]|uniref:START domain-containing protein n=1 Tax=Litoribacillus peritrichatus TaxID=718191 RepID=A0ABP7M4C1_9GAMM